MAAGCWTYLALVGKGLKREEGNLGTFHQMYIRKEESLIFILKLNINTLRVHCIKFINTCSLYSGQINHSGLNAQ